MDQEGNIYDLAGNFIGTTDGEGEGNAGKITLNLSKFYRS